MNSKSTMVVNKNKQKCMLLDNIQIEQTQALKQLYSFNDNFKKKVANPISSIEAIQQSKLPQRCQQHNNALSLYCVFDRKPLCVSCAYQNTHHKKHQVLPLPRSQNYLKQDSKSYENRIQQLFTLIHQNMRRSAQNIVHFERVIPGMVYQITKFYSKLKETIGQIQKNQIKMVNDFRQMVKKQHLIIHKQLQNTLTFLRLKMHKISKFGQQQLLIKRNMAEVLSQTYKIFPKKLIPEKKLNNLLNPRDYSQMQDYVSKKLHLSLKLQNYYANFQQKQNSIQGSTNLNGQEKTTKKVKFESRPVTCRNQRGNQKRIALNNSASNIRNISASPRRNNKN